jgi:hypothetical protein
MMQKHSAVLVSARIYIPHVILGLFLLFPVFVRPKFASSERICDHIHAGKESELPDPELLIEIPYIIRDILRADLLSLPRREL